MENSIKLKEIFNKNETALLIIDAQVDFCSAEGMLAKKLGVDVSRIEKCIPVLNSFIEYCRSEGIAIIWIRQELLKEKMYDNQKNRLLDENGQVWYDQPGSAGSQWHGTMTRPIDSETVITKNSYCSFKDTDLHLRLQAAGIRSLLLTGFTTGVCVETTARSGYLNGYNVAIVSDCTEAHTEEEYVSALTAIRTFFGWTPSSGEIRDLWK
ncbi:cysteine hydrolase family protein [Bacilliculturomica massiliensis]|uniref:cysteine hydrolase family protein n=1 Tax=Bacilliculturomica massiliensis TaxID=1917867 RepID=UPI001031C4B8|nr:isochorismatase family cysteine hydrolase [Bacilliculturomica massiliensis]